MYYIALAFNFNKFSICVCAVLWLRNLFFVLKQLSEVYLGKKELGELDKMSKSQNKNRKGNKNQKGWGISAVFRKLKW